jgi:hypothetical protein
LKELVAAGLATADINVVGAAFDPPFQVDRKQVDNYKRQLKPRIKAIIEAKKDSPLKRGLALKENRVELLQQLADIMSKDLIEDKMTWVVDNVQIIGKGDQRKLIEFEKFNGAEVRELRGALDDIAKEMGDRVIKNEITGKDGTALLDPIRQMMAEVYGHPYIPAESTD